LRSHPGGELDHPSDDGVRNVYAPREPDLFFQRRVLRRVETSVNRSVAIDAGVHYRLQRLFDDLGACDERGDFLFLLYLPLDKVFDVG